MNDYLDIFTVVEQDESGGIYEWLGWTIYWNAELGEGELCNPDGVFHTDGDDLEELATEAVQHEEGWR